MDECDWTRCAAPARLDLLLGHSLAGAERIGAFCVPHASLSSIDAQRRAGAPTWYDWHRPPLEAELAGGASRSPEAPARVIPLFRGAKGRRGQRPPEPVWLETDVADP
jgi:hypothetical protein